MAALARADGERAEADRRRETLRVEAIEREYRAKLDDLRRNYALRVTSNGSRRSTSMYRCSASRC